ncbi:8637_t:CDS:2 [Funneliformis mosseae]|uniref:8637_t:CDS:1 n=1 Tax=Funneliformis mosseae TaxID=27381 RepID=A0A9N9FQC8_FUNMO|nr:8637_t:CDS:2 [Funneliformis mosseae]
MRVLSFMIRGGSETDILIGSKSSNSKSSSESKREFSLLTKLDMPIFYLKRLEYRFNILISYAN